MSEQTYGPYPGDANHPDPEAAGRAFVEELKKPIERGAITIRVPFTERVVPWEGTDRGWWRAVDGSMAITVSRDRREVRIELNDVYASVQAAWPGEAKPVAPALGYVVRGKGTCCAEHEWAAVHQEVIEGTPDRAEATEFSTPREAFAVATRFEEARILAIAEDGTETPLPTYGEALEQISRIMDATAGIGFTGPEDRATERVDLLLASRESIARQRDEVQAERDAERKAWARLAVAGFVQAVEQRPDTLAEYDGARRALQALGVDVDDLLEKANR